MGRYGTGLATTILLVLCCPRLRRCTSALIGNRRGGKEKKKTGTWPVAIEALVRECNGMGRHEHGKERDSLCIGLRTYMALLANVWAKRSLGLEKFHLLLEKHCPSLGNHRALHLHLRTVF